MSVKIALAGNPNSGKTTFLTKIQGTTMMYGTGRGLKEGKKKEK